VARLAHLPRLESLQLRDRGLLIEDLEPLAASGTLKTLDADITTTEDERRMFVTSHPDLKVQWPKRSKPTPSWSPQIDVSEEWQVMTVLYDRWRKQDGAKNPAGFDHTQMDFSEIRLTSKRVQRIPPNVLSSVVDVSLGQVESIEVALAFLKQCGTLQCFDARRVPLTKAALDRIHFSDGYDLYLQQGPITVEEFREFNRALKPNSLAIFSSSFSENEAEQIQSASPNTVINVYSGFVEDETESIYPPSYEPDPNSPFH
jgi:hypothetical protein